MLDINGLMVFYENALAINDLTCNVNEGEIVGLLGSNSAGKTTLLNTIAGLTEDLRIKEARRGGTRITVLGEIRYNGKDIANIYPSDRVKMGIVLCRERHPVFKESDVLENLKIASYLTNRKRAKELIDYVFELFSPLQKLKKRKAGFMSGGEQQMLAIGMSIIANPRLLLLDEPLLGLSPAAQIDLVKTITTLRKDTGITILVSEQFARPLLPIIDRGYVIENGILTFSGTRKELFDNPEVKAAYFGI
jgi:branched-chain amino acid transport system ATP-binding protein